MKKPIRYCRDGNSYVESGQESANLTGEDLVRYILNIGVADPFKDHVNLTVESPRVLGGDILKAEKGWEAVEHIPAMIDSILSCLSDGSDLSAEETTGYFSALKSAFSKLVLGAISENKHAELFEKTEEVIASFEKHSDNPAYYSEMLDIIAMASMGLKKTRLNFLSGTEYERLDLQRQDLTAEGKQGEAAHLRNVINGFGGAKFRPRNDAESKARDEKQELDKISRNIKFLDSLSEEVYYNSLGPEVENSREIATRSVSELGKGEGLAFSETSDWGIALAFISKDTGKKAGVLCSECITKRSFKAAADKAALGNERGYRDLRAVIIGGSSMEDVRYVAPILEFCKENEIAIGAASLCNENIPRGFVIGDDAVVQGRASVRDVNLHLQRRLMENGLISDKTDGSSFSSLTSEEKPFVYLPDRKEGGLLSGGSYQALQGLKGLDQTGQLATTLGTPPDPEHLKELGGEGELPSDRDIFLFTASFPKVLESLDKQIDSLCKFLETAAIKQFGEKDKNGNYQLGGDLKLKNSLGKRSVAPRLALSFGQEQMLQSPPALFIGKGAGAVNGSIVKSAVAELETKRPGRKSPSVVEVHPRKASVRFTKQFIQGVNNAVAKEAKGNAPELDSVRELISLCQAPRAI